MAESLDLEKMNIDAEALNFMAQGKRHLLVHDYNSAVQCLEQACKLYDEKYGVNADECADAYLNYGHALLELHRQETGALDGLAAKEQLIDEEDEDVEAEAEDEELKDDELDNKSTTENKEANGDSKADAAEEDISLSPSAARDDQQTVNSTNNGTSTTEPVCSSSKSNGNASTSGADEEVVDKEMETDEDPNQPSTSTGITNEDRLEEEEDSAPSNIEVAFEVLSMAKNIYQRQNEYRDDSFLKLSDTLQKLGEILIEWENNDEALKELNDCLEIRMRHLPDDDRLIAEAYYHIGLTHSLNSNVPEANASFQRAVDVIEQRLNRLKSSYTSEPEGDNRLKIETEIKDLEYVLPEMKSKIEDTPEQVLSPSRLQAAVDEDVKLEDEKFAEKQKQILARPISNVTHLVKRKREEPAELDSNAKKLKNENGSSNGVHNVEMKED